MNPAYGTEELEGYFADLHPRALITQAGIDSPARRAALLAGVRVIELSTASDAEAGLFTLTGDQEGAASDQPVSAGDTALLLLTSGTTSRPKIVPQTHVNMCTSAYAHGAALALTRNRSMLEHHALVSRAWSPRTLIASLAAGASVGVPPALTSSASPHG